MTSRMFKMMFPEKTGSIELLRYYRDEFGICINEAAPHQERLLEEFLSDDPKDFDTDTFLEVFIAEDLNPGMDHTISCTRNGKASLMMTMYNARFEGWSRAIPVLMEYGYDVLVLTSEHCYHNPGKCFSVIVSETERSPKGVSEIYRKAQRRVTLKEIAASGLG